jgi:type VI secretion system secreted protein Hcp
VHDVRVTKFVDKSSAPLMLYCASGQHFPEGLITVRKAGDKPLEYLKIKLTDILVSGIQQAGHGTELITENVTLNFAKSDGSGQPAGEMGWDIKANQKV